MADEELVRIMEMIGTLGKLPSKIGPDDDFYDAGFSSLVVLNLVMDLEDAFSVSFEGQDEEFIKARTPRGIHALIQRLR